MKRQSISPTWQTSLPLTLWPTHSAGSQSRVKLGESTYDLSAETTQAAPHPALRPRYLSLILCALLIMVVISLAAAAERPTPLPTSSPATTTPVHSAVTIPRNNEEVLMNATTPDASNDYVAPDTSTSSTENNSSSSVQLQVNGQDVAVPANGTTSQTVSNSDGTTTVQVSHSQNSSQTDVQTNIDATSNGNTSLIMNSQSSSRSSP